MAAVHTTRGASQGLSVGSRLTHAITGVFDAVKDWNDARLTRKALNRLTDRELADIGLTRDDVLTLNTRSRA